MEITNELVEHLSTLSRLEFEPEQKEKFKNEFSNILTEIDKINKVDLENIKIDCDALDAKTELRKDEVKQGLQVKEVVKNAPKSLGNSILIPTEII